MLPAAEIDDRTTLGEVYLSSLIRAQLRLALGVLAILGGLIGSLPLLFFLLPGLADIRLLGMPLPWVLLGFAAYPFLVLCGWGYVHRAERNERVFVAMVDPDSRAGPRAGTPPGRSS